MSLFKKLKLKKFSFSWEVLFILILVVSGLTSFIVQVISTGLPLYCIDIGKTTAEAGILTGFYTIAVIISRPLMGKWCDEKGKYKIAIIGIALFILSIACSFLNSFSYLPLLQAIEGFGFSALSTALAALVIDLLPPSSIVRGIGLFTVIKSLSISLGASFAVSFAEKFGVQNIFLCSFIICLFALLAIIPLRRSSKYERKKETNNDKYSNQYRGLDKFIEKSILSVCLIQFIFTFALTLGTSYLPSYAQTIGLVGIGIYYTVSAITMFLSRTLLSKFFEKINPTKSFIIGMTLATITTIAIILVNSLPLFVFISFFNAIAISLINPTLNVKATANVDADRRGVASSTYYGILDLGSGIGSTIWGILIPIIDYKWSFILATVLLVFNYFYGLYIFKKRKV